MGGYYVTGTAEASGHVFDYCLPRSGATHAAILCGSDRAETEKVAAILAGNGSGTCLIPFPVDDWDACLTPWQSDCLPGREFSGLADRETERLTTLAFLMKGICGKAMPRERLIIAGYSLGGLFAMYMYEKTGLFGNAASVSGAMWYPGFVGYMSEKGKREAGDRLYFSIGRQEVKRGNAIMRGGQEACLAILNAVAPDDPGSTFVLNDGNHFFEPDKRMARALEFITQ